MALSLSQSLLLLFAFLLFGSMNTILTKVQLTASSVGIDGEAKLFQKPWFQTFNMMLSMFYVLSHRCCRPARARQVEHINGDALNPGGAPGPSQSKKMLLVAVPAFFDIVATALGAAGMMYIPASLWQILRGSALVFAALLSILCLNHKMQGFHWLGLLLCVVGVAIVGTANLLDASAAAAEKDPGESGAAGTMIGIGLVLFGQVMQAGQVIAEEFLMKDCELEPFDVIGIEGMWGVLQMLVVVYPITYLFNVEDPFDTLVMLRNSGTLTLIIFAFQFSCATFNMTGIVITSYLSAVHRMMLDASRTMVVWGFGLFMHYAVDEESLCGEVWTKHSKIQFLGFCVLLVGQATYGKLILWRCCAYPTDVAADLPVDFPQASICSASPATLRMGANMMGVEGQSKRQLIKSPRSAVIQAA